MAAGDRRELAGGRHLLPASTRLGQVRLAVSDLDRSVDYYGEVMGLQLRSGEGRSAVLATHDGQPLVELYEEKGASPVPPRGRLGLYHFALLLPDRASLGSFLRHLAQREERVGMADHLVSEALYLQDPDGLGIEVYADRPRSSWERRDGELLMDTLPLDVRDLVSRAGERSWSGLPAGTRVGHVHLHVDDLERAGHFYGSLGLEPVVWSFPGALFMSAGGYHHHLGLNTWAAGAGRAEEGDARLLSWTILLDDEGSAGKAAYAMTAQGYDVARTSAGWETVDPWGVRLRLAAGRTAGSS